MNEEITITITPRARAALDELQALIIDRYPEATFAVEKSYEPAGIYLVATVDVDDVDEVFGVVVDRIVDFQIEEIPVFVTVSQPRERVLAQFREYQEQQSRMIKIDASLPDRIVQDPAIMLGHPVVKGTLVPAEMVLAHLARTTDVDELLNHYPEITRDDVRACLAFARTLVAGASRQEELAAPAAR